MHKHNHDMDNMDKRVQVTAGKLYIIIPCYNEEQVLPLTAPLFRAQLEHLIQQGLVAPTSCILLVDDGSCDQTWTVITQLAQTDDHFVGIRQSRNRGHQNAVLAGLMEVRERCDLTISIDCDGQDDIAAMEAMVRAFNNGYEIVYGVRADRTTDSWFKRVTAQLFYKGMQLLGTEVLYNHADYRLISAQALQALAQFPEVNLFLRGMVPLVGFSSTQVTYKRERRLAGHSHYPLSKMLALALDGITSLSIRPLRLIVAIGLLLLLGSLLLLIYSIILGSGDQQVRWFSVGGLFSSLQLIALGVVGEYVGKTYLETKHRPRYIISDRTGENERRGAAITQAGGGAAGLLFKLVAWSGGPLMNAINRPT